MQQVSWYSKKFSFVVILVMIFCAAIPARAQPGDTIVITGKNVNPSVLREGTHRYLVYFKMGKDSTRKMTQFWTRDIHFADYNGAPAIIISQSWEDKDTIVHTVKSVCDRKTLQPLYHESWWKQRGSSTFDFVNRTAIVNGSPLTDADTAKARKNAWQAFKASWDQYVLNWHLDLETFPVLPYKEGRTFMIPYYDPGFPAPKNIPYTVTGSGTITGYDNKEIDCWLLQHEEKNNKEIFWVSKKTKEVLKLEQEFSGRYRYKIKLAFSN